MLSKFKDHLKINFPFIDGKKVLIAVSGGIDSMVLIDLCKKSDLDISIAHCNFQLRGQESDLDEELVKSVAIKSNIPIYIKKFDTDKFAAKHKLSIQLAARQLRYNWFYELAENYEYDFVFTAHHLDDSVETFLINLTRGTGIEGLVGIPEINENIIRPLLIFSREEILMYANANVISWREDSSNASNKYLRNKLRHNVIPILKELNPSFLNSFKNTINSLKQTQSLETDASLNLYNKVVCEEGDILKIDINKLLKYKNYKSYLYKWLAPFGFKAWNDIYDLVNAQSGKQVLAEKYRLIKDRTFLLVEELAVIQNNVFYINEGENIKIPINIRLSEQSSLDEVSKKEIYVDKDLLKFPLEVRKGKKGDYFCPIGMHGKKKLSKFFKDEKFSLIDKENTWLLCSQDNIVWVINKRQDERFKVKPSTKNIYKIELL